MDRLDHLLRNHLSGGQRLDADEIIAEVAHRIRRRRRMASGLVAAAVLILIVGIVGAAAGLSRQNQLAHPPGATLTTPPAPTVSPSATEPGLRVTSPRPTITGVLGDGRYFADLVAVDPAGRVTFDVMQYLTGEAAKQAWREQNPQDPDGPPNDYLVVNDNPGVRIMTVSDNVRVELADMNNIPNTVAVLLAALPEVLARPHTLWVWLTISGGKITMIEEPYRP